MLTYEQIGIQTIYKKTYFISHTNLASSLLPLRTSYHTNSFLQKEEKKESQLHITGVLEK